MDTFVRDGDRAALLASHDKYVRRLQRASDDFDATRKLKAVITALQRWPAQPPTVSQSA